MFGFFFRLTFICGCLSEFTVLPIVVVVFSVPNKNVYNRTYAYTTPQLSIPMIKMYGNEHNRNRQNVTLNSWNKKMQNDSYLPYLRP